MKISLVARRQASLSRAEKKLEEIESVCDEYCSLNQGFLCSDLLDESDKASRVVTRKVGLLVEAQNVEDLQKEIDGIAKKMAEVKKANSVDCNAPKIKRTYTYHPSSAF